MKPYPIIVSVLNVFKQKYTLDGCPGEYTIEVDLGKYCHIQQTDTGQVIRGVPKSDLKKVEEK